MRTDHRRWLHNIRDPDRIDEDYCGNVVLGGPVTANNMTIYIKDGYLDLNRKTFTGSGTTLIFTGSDTAGDFHGLKAGTRGALHIEAPTSGDWKGVALFQDHRVTKGVNLEIEGNDPEIRIKGLVYMPGPDWSLREQSTRALILSRAWS
jgi:hypothetical protein